MNKMIKFILGTFVGFICYLFLTLGLSNLYDHNIFSFDSFELDPLILYSLAMFLVAAFEGFFLDKWWWASGLLIAAIDGYFSIQPSGDKTGIGIAFAFNLLIANIFAAVLGSTTGWIVRKKCVRRS